MPVLILTVTLELIIHGVSLEAKELLKSSVTTQYLAYLEDLCSKGNGLLVNMIMIYSKKKGWMTRDNRMSNQLRQTAC